MNIVSGIIKSNSKIVLYGPSGIGKTTFASKFPNPLFADIEQGSNELNVKRTPRVDSWQILSAIIDELIKDQGGFKTFVIDTLDWAEMLCKKSICDKAKVNSIGDAPYGKLYSQLGTEWKQFLDKLTVLGDKMNIVLLAHSTLEHTNIPEEMAEFDRHTMKLTNSFKTNISAITMEWASCVFFANYEVFIIQDDAKKGYAQGGKRLLFTTFHPCWSAKNRFNLPEKLPFEYNSIKQIVNTEEIKESPKIERAPITQPTTVVIPTNSKPVQGRPEGIPDKLWDLMVFHSVTTKEIQKVVAEKGYYPEDTPIKNYDENFINGVLIGAWDKVCAAIKQF